MGAGRAGAIPSLAIDGPELAAVLGQVGHAMPDTVSKRGALLYGRHLPAPARDRGFQRWLPPGAAPAVGAAAARYPGDRAEAACTALQPLLRDLPARSGFASRRPGSRSCAPAGFSLEARRRHLSASTRARCRSAWPDPVVVNRTALADAVARVRQVALDQKRNAIVLSGCAGELVITTDDETRRRRGRDPRERRRVRLMSASMVGISPRRSPRYPVPTWSSCTSRQPDRAAWLCAAGEEHDGVVLMAMRVLPPKVRQEQPELRHKERVDADFA